MRILYQSQVERSCPHIDVSHTEPGYHFHLLKQEPLQIGVKWAQVNKTDSAVAVEDD